MAINFVAVFSLSAHQQYEDYFDLRRVFLVSSAGIDSANSDRACNNFAQWYSQPDTSVAGKDSQYQRAEGVIGTTVIQGVYCCYFFRIRGRVILVSTSSWNDPFRAKKIMAVAKGMFMRADKKDKDLKIAEQNLYRILQLEFIVKEFEPVYQSRKLRQSLESIIDAENDLKQQLIMKSLVYPVSESYINEPSDMNHILPGFDYFDENSDELGEMPELSKTKSLYTRATSANLYTRATGASASLYQKPVYQEKNGSTDVKDVWDNEQKEGINNSTPVIDGIPNEHPNLQTIKSIDSVETSASLEKSNTDIFGPDPFAEVMALSKPPAKLNVTAYVTEDVSCIYNGNNLGSYKLEGTINIVTSPYTTSPFQFQILDKARNIQTVLENKKFLKEMKLSSAQEALGLKSYNCSLPSDSIASLQEQSPQIPIIKYRAGVNFKPVPLKVMSRVNFTENSKSVKILLQIIINPNMEKAVTSVTALVSINIPNVTFTKECDSFSDVKWDSQKRILECKIGDIKPNQKIVIEAELTKKEATMMPNKTIKTLPVIVKGQMISTTLTKSNMRVINMPDMKEKIQISQQIHTRVRINYRIEP